MFEDMEKEWDEDDPLEVQVVVKKGDRVLIQETTIQGKDDNEMWNFDRAIESIGKFERACNTWERTEAVGRELMKDNF